MARIKLGEKLVISKKTWVASSSNTERVNHYSIPNFDAGEPIEEPSETILSNKYLITEPCILISKLNPSQPRIWLIEKLLPGVSVCSTEFVVLHASNCRELPYLYFALKSPEVTRKLVEFATGTSNSHQRVRPSDILEIEIEWPHSNEQRRIISDFLLSIEKKIEINAKISLVTERLAQTIFKSWFIDFDPVKAKMVGEKPAGMDPATAALFPDTLEESELGLIPKGWEIRKIESLCETLLGGTPSRAKDEFWNGDVPWINSGKVNDFRITSASENITKLGLEKSATKLLPKGTTVLAITGATLGQFSRLEIDSCANQSVVGILGSAEASNEFIYLNVKNGIQRLISAQTGGAQQHINKDDVNSFSIIYPGETLMKIFTDAVDGIFQEIGVVLNQSISLAEIRDSLLPRLISGEVQIPKEMLAS